MYEQQWKGPNPATQNYAIGSIQSLSGPGSDYNSATAIEPASIIREVLNSGDHTLGELHEAITYLEKRLDTILTPMPPTNAGSGTCAPNGPPASALTGRLALLNEGHRQAVQRLRDLMARIEV